MRMLAGLLALTLGACAPSNEAAVEPQPKPVLGLVTSLPIVFGPGFSLEGGSPLLAALEEHYEVRALAATDAQSLEGVDQLLMAHALPQTADNLVALDEWVRGGGEVVLLADPRFDGDVGLPLGHPQAPPLFFGDTGLLGHWGLTLAGPVEGDEVAGIGVSSAGRLQSDGKYCTTEAAGFAAMCALEQGHAFVVADADFLSIDPEQASVLILGALDRMARDDVITGDHAN